MRDSEPVAVEAAVREGLAAADVPLYTCLFGVRAEVFADSALVGVVTAAAEAVDDDGIVEVSVDVDERGVRIRVRGGAVVAADDLPPRLRHAERVLERYGGGLDVERADGETTLTLALVRADT